MAEDRNHRNKAPYFNKEQEGPYREEDIQRNTPGHYQIRRKEFGHGESGTMYPNNREDYSETGLKGRDYERNIGYREGYQSLDTEGARQNKASHRGKGPRSYQRSDDRIREDINEQLSDDHYVDASDIEVEVQQSEVTLTGTVESRQIKRRVEDIIEQISGVKHVENRLRISKQQNDEARTEDRYIGNTRSNFREQGQ